MQTIRVVPCLDVDKGRIVKGISFVNLLDIGDPVEHAIIYDKEGADELVFLDISASYEGRKIITYAVFNVCSCISIPLTVGGGIISLLQIEELLEKGVDRVSVNTACVKKPLFINEAVKKFGSRHIVVAIDAKRKGDSWEVYINGGRTPAGIDVIEWAKEVADRGCSEILLTSIDHDGKKAGYDLPLIKNVSSSIDIPIIASGGAGCPEHLYQAVVAGASAVLAASIFHYGEYTIKEVKEYLFRKNVPVKM